jgi:hypothetical protein
MFSRSARTPRACGRRSTARLPQRTCQSHYPAAVDTPFGRLKQGVPRFRIPNGSQLFVYSSGARRADFVGLVSTDGRCPVPGVRSPESGGRPLTLGGHDAAKKCGKVAGPSRQFGNTSRHFGNTSWQFGNTSWQFAGSSWQFGNTSRQFAASSRHFGNTSWPFAGSSGHFGNSRRQSGNTRRQFGNTCRHFGNTCRESSEGRARVVNRDGNRGRGGTDNSRRDTPQHKPSRSPIQSPRDSMANGEWRIEKRGRDSPFAIRHSSLNVRWAGRAEPAGPRHVIQGRGRRFHPF